MNNLIDPSAKIGRNVTIGHGTRVYANVEIGDGCTIGDFCVIGHPGPGENGPLVLGTGATVRSHAVLYEGSTIGPMLEILCACTDTPTLAREQTLVILSGCFR
jgi:UDP-3-O-[3-hydroxymyristoyl] glucosamine N-acyltransferase